MTEDQSAEILEELMERIETGPDSHTSTLAQIAEKYRLTEEFREVISKLNESLGVIRIVLKYLLFDVEATCRERDALRTILEDQE